jgi:serine/threonine-protein kinase
LYWQRVDANTNEAQPLTKSTNPQYPASWDPQGTLLAFEEWNPQTNSDLMILPVAGDEASGWKIGTPTVFLNTLSAERMPMFSPHDGRWIAYVSNESGNDEVYVRPYPGPGGKTKISIDGGEAPNWSPVRNEIFYVQGGQVMVAAYTVKGDTFSPEKAQIWSPGSVRGPTGRGVALHPDGERFAVEGFAETPTDAWLGKVVFIFNFFDELRRIAPAAKR